MRILGLTSIGHDVSLCLLEDGELKIAIEQERINRKKNSWGFPEKLFISIFKKTGLELNDIDHIAFYYDPQKDWGAVLKHLIRFPKSYPFLLTQIAARASFKSMKHYFRMYNQRFFGSKKVPSLHYIEHHLAHASSAFLVSPYEEAAVLVIDGQGEMAATTLWRGEGTKLEKLAQINFPHSLGFIYGGVTAYLGFKPTADEYKVMGLAAYGKPTFYDFFKDLIILKEDGSYAFNTTYINFQNDYGLQKGTFFTKKATDILGPKKLYLSKKEPDQRQADIAFSLQKRVEETALHLCKHLHKLTNLENICLAGGVGHNSVMNGYLALNSPFKNVYLSPNPGDGGCSVGCAFNLYHKLSGKKRKYVMNDAYLGYEYSKQDIKSTLRKFNLKYKEVGDPAKTAAKLIAKGYILGWFQGKSEFGPRALGNRSILADPRGQNIKKKLNSLIKNRESFRPFAPSVIEEKASDFFEGISSSPFMSFVANVDKHKRKLIPSVIHIDGTARLQTVNKKQNLLFYNLIEHFYKITGIPMVLNTSFNVQGEPIILTPCDAIRTFFASALSYLIIGNFLLAKDKDNDYRKNKQKRLLLK